jgi:hypothetical protein
MQRYHTAPARLGLAIRLSLLNTHLVGLGSAARLIADRLTKDWP